jgi:predicted enzyme related to lactoylglutathione lyase
VHNPLHKVATPRRARATRPEVWSLAATTAASDQSSPTNAWWATCIGAYGIPVSERVNPVIFVDFPCPDPEAMSNFYADLFGWTFNRRPAGEFHEILPGVKPNLGIHHSEAAMSGAVPRVYVMVDEPPAYLARAVELGATVLWEERPWEEFNARYAAFRDPWGAEICLWRDKGTYRPPS